MHSFPPSLPHHLLWVCLHGRYLCWLLRRNVFPLALDVWQRWLRGIRCYEFCIGRQGHQLRLPRSDLRQSWLLLLRTMGNVEFLLFTNSFPCTDSRQKRFGICGYVFNTGCFLFEKILLLLPTLDVLFRLDFRKRELGGIRFERSRRFSQRRNGRFFFWMNSWRGLCRWRCRSRFRDGRGLSKQPLLCQFCFHSRLFSYRCSQLAHRSIDLRLINCLRSFMNPRIWLLGQMHRYVSIQRIFPHLGLRNICRRNRFLLNRRNRLTHRMLRCRRYRFRRNSLCVFMNPRRWILRRGRCCFRIWRICSRFGLLGVCSRLWICQGIKMQKR